MAICDQANGRVKQDVLTVNYMEGEHTLNFIPTQPIADLRLLLPEIDLSESAKGKRDSSQGRLTDQGKNLSVID